MRVNTATLFWDSHTKRDLDAQKEQLPLSSERSRDRPELAGLKEALKRLGGNAKDKEADGKTDNCKPKEMQRRIIETFKEIRRAHDFGVPQAAQPMVPELSGVYLPYAALQGVRVGISTGVLADLAGIGAGCDWIITLDNLCASLKNYSQVGSIENAGIRAMLVNQIATDLAVELQRIPELADFFKEHSVASLKLIAAILPMLARSDVLVSTFQAQLMGALRDGTTDPAGIAKLIFDHVTSGIKDIIDQFDGNVAEYLNSQFTDAIGKHTLLDPASVNNADSLKSFLDGWYNVVFSVVNILGEVLGYAGSSLKIGQGVKQFITVLSDKEKNSETKSKIDVECTETGRLLLAADRLADATVMKALHEHMELRRLRLGYQADLNLLGAGNKLVLGLTQLAMIVAGMLVVNPLLGAAGLGVSAVYIGIIGIIQLIASKKASEDAKRDCAAENDFKALKSSADCLRKREELDLRSSHLDNKDVVIAKVLEILRKESRGGGQRIVRDGLLKLGVPAKVLDAAVLPSAGTGKDDGVVRDLLKLYLYTSQMLNGPMVERYLDDLAGKRGDLARLNAAVLLIQMFPEKKALVAQAFHKPFTSTIQYLRQQLVPPRGAGEQRYYKFERQVKRDANRKEMPGKDTMHVEALLKFARDRNVSAFNAMFRKIESSPLFSDAVITYAKARIDDEIKKCAEKGRMVPGRELIARDMDARARVLLEYRKCSELSNLELMAKKGDVPGMVLYERLVSQLGEGQAETCKKISEFMHHMREETNREALDKLEKKRYERDYGRLKREVDNIIEGRSDGATLAKALIKFDPSVEESWKECWRRATHDLKSFREKVYEVQADAKSAGVDVSLLDIAGIVLGKPTAGADPEGQRASVIADLLTVEKLDNEDVIFLFKEHFRLSGRLPGGLLQLAKDVLKAGDFTLREDIVSVRSLLHLSATGKDDGSSWSPHTWQCLKDAARHKDKDASTLSAARKVLAGRYAKCFPINVWDHLWNNLPYNDLYQAVKKFQDFLDSNDISFAWIDKFRYDTKPANRIDAAVAAALEQHLKAMIPAPDLSPGSKGDVASRQSLTSDDSVPKRGREWERPVKYTETTTGILEKKLLNVNVPGKRDESPKQTPVIDRTMYGVHARYLEKLGVSLPLERSADGVDRPTANRIIAALEQKRLPLSGQHAYEESERLVSYMKELRSAVERTRASHSVFPDAWTKESESVLRAVSDRNMKILQATAQHLKHKIKTVDENVDAAASRLMFWLRDNPEWVARVWKDGKDADPQRVRLMVWAISGPNNERRKRLEAAKRLIDACDAMGVNRAVRLRLEDLFESIPTDLDRFIDALDVRKQYEYFELVEQDDDATQCTQTVSTAPSTPSPLV